MTTVVTFDFGPAEVFVVRYRGRLPDTRVLGALADLVAAETVRLLDILVVSRDGGGAVEVIEIDDLPSGSPFDAFELEARGITGNEDVERIADDLGPGTSAAIAVIEQLWAKSLAERFAESDAELLETVRIPAPELNAIAVAANIA